MGPAADPCTLEGEAIVAPAIMCQRAKTKAHNHQCIPPIYNALVGGAIGTVVTTHQPLVHGASDFWWAPVRSLSVLDRVRDVVLVGRIDKNKRSQPG